MVISYSRMSALSFINSMNDAVYEFMMISYG